MPLIGFKLKATTSLRLFLGRRIFSCNVLPTKLLTLSISKNFWLHFISGKVAGILGGELLKKDSMKQLSCSWAKVSALIPTMRTSALPSMWLSYKAIRILLISSSREVPRSPNHNILLRRLTPIKEASASSCEEVYAPEAILDDKYMNTLRKLKEMCFFM